MGVYDLTLLFLGVLLIGLIFSRSNLAKTRTLLLFILSLAMFLVVFFAIHHHFQKTCIILAGDSFSDIKQLILSWGVAAPLMSVILMTMQAVIAPLPAFLITAANGLVFGIYWGTVISWIGAMCGALASFMISRIFFERFSRKILSHKTGARYLNELSSKYGFKVILTARLLPFISFDFVSYAAGLSTIRIGTFFLATGLGMLPATIVYTVFGFEMEKLKEYSDRLFTFSILLVFALLLVWAVQGMYKHRKDISRAKIDGNPDSDQD